MYVRQLTRKDTFLENLFTPLDYKNYEFEDVGLLDFTKPEKQKLDKRRGSNLRNRRRPFRTAAMR